MHRRQILYESCDTLQYLDMASVGMVIHHDKQMQRRLMHRRLNLDSQWIHHQDAQIALRIYLAAHFPLVQAVISALTKGIDASALFHYTSWQLTRRRQLAVLNCIHPVKGRCSQYSRQPIWTTSSRAYFGGLLAANSCLTGFQTNVNSTLRSQWSLF